MRRQMALRIRIITGCILVLALILIGRLYQLQVLDNDLYTEKAERQYIHTKQDLMPYQYIEILQNNSGMIMK